MDQSAAATRPRPRRRVGAIIFGVLALAVVLLILLWNWDWFIPIVQSQASAAVGRRVTIKHLHVQLGRQTTVAADDVLVANPDGFPAADPLAAVKRLTIVANVVDYIRHGTIVLPRITLDRPDVHATGLKDGTNNWALHLPTAKPGAKPSPPPQIGDLVINQGTARVIDPKFRSDFSATIATRAASGSEPSAITANAHGTLRRRRR